MTQEFLDDLRSKANNATQGTWTWEDEGNYHATVYSGREKYMHGLNLFGRLELDSNGKNNLDFITSASPEIVLALLAEIERLRKE